MFKLQSSHAKDKRRIDFSTLKLPVRGGWSTFRQAAFQDDRDLSDAFEVS
jgi:hypothetical protein